jgi:DNA-binding transcriptional MocR family regulator
MNTIWSPDLAQFPGPKFLSLSRALREAIRQGQLEPGSRLPPVRDLAFHLGITPGTVARAYQLATQEGLLNATVGRGTFVAAATPRLGPTQPLFLERLRPTPNGIVDMRAPLLPDVGQTAAFSDLFAGISRDMAGDWLDYPDQREEATLRTAICGWLGDRLLGPIGPADITLTNGGQNAILSILLCCLRGDRPVVLTEELAYPGFRHAARLARAETVGVEIDAQGIIPAALEAACRRHGPQVLCLTVEAQNPTTVRMGAERRAAIAAIARKFDLQIIEDDCYSVADSDLPAIRALAPERSWYVGSWSKTLSAALRFGYIVCPTAMGVAGRLTTQHSFFALSRVVTELALHLLQSGQAVRIRQAVQVELGERSQLIVNHLGSHALGWQKGLPFVWLPLPSGWRGSTFARQAEAEGVIVRSADEYALIHGRAPHAVRLAVNGMIPRDRLEAAVDRLAGLLARPPADLCV